MRPNNPLIQQLRHAETMIELVAKGEFTCTAISGPPGIGKTHLAIKVLNRMGVAHQTIRGSGAGLMLAAYELRAGGIILLDDADNLVVGGGTTQANLVKQLTAPGTTRLISNHTEKASTNAARQNPKDGIAPPEFRSRAGLIWLTNVDLTRGTADPAHMAALADRGMRPIVLSSDRRDIIDYVFDLIVERDLLRKAGASLQQAQEVTDWLAENCYHVETLSIRVLLDVLKFRRALPDKWREMAAMRLRPTAIQLGSPPDAPRIIPPRDRKAACSAALTL